MTDQKGLGQRSDAELESLFGNMYAGWARGVNVTQERFGDGETRFTETAMTPLELAARYVAAEIGSNIYEIANRAAFAPITVFSQIQARIGPVFEEAATALEAKDKELADWKLLAKSRGEVLVSAIEQMKEAQARAETAERELPDLIGIRNMLILCGELGGMRPGESAVAYLRRLIDGLIGAERERDEARAALAAETQRADDNSRTCHGFAAALRRIEAGEAEPSNIALEGLSNPWGAT